MKRHFFTGAALRLGVVAMASLLLAAAGPPALAQKPIVWKVGGGWPAANPFHHSVIEIGKQVELMSGARLKWEIYAAGTLVPAFEVLDAVHRGVLGEELELSVVTLPAGEILPALERGTIDGAEFSVPAVDKTPTTWSSTT